MGAPTGGNEVVPAWPPMLHDIAPDFRARTTMGERTLSGYRGSWVLLFSHPADFTPVCTSEFIAFAAAAEQFGALDCHLLALSVDSLFSHIAWIRSIHERFGIRVDFPMIEDPSMAIARAYGMVRPGAADAALVRAVFVIDPSGIIRAMSWYPMTTGRSVEELLRLVAALRTADAHDVSTPEGWRPGEDVILAPPMTAEAALDGAAAQEMGAGPVWYYRTGALPTKHGRGGA